MSAFRFGIIGLLIIAAPSYADDKDEETKRAAKFSQVVKTMQAFTINDMDANGEKSSLLLPPVLRYSDPIDSQTFPTIPDGAVFVFTRNGQPLAVTAMHLGAKNDIWAEFLSLAAGPLTASRGNQVIWQPTKSAAEFTLIREAPEPLKTAPLRLTQMRSILSSFSASITDQVAGRQELRLLSQPIFRYSDSEKGIMDGALFVFARNTNPEMLLALEARTDNVKSSWVYAPLRFTGRQAELRCPDDHISTHARIMGRTPRDSFFQLLILPEPATP